MSENFLRFKRKSNAYALILSLCAGGAVGTLCGGVLLVLSKLCVLNIPPIAALPIGALVFVGIVVAFYLIMRKSDLDVARELDGRFGLEERVETMLAYKDGEGAMLELQREDADKALSRLSTKDFKNRRAWIFFLALFVGAAALAAGLFVPDLRDYTPPEEVVPFELTEMQRAGINELISYVESSEMEEPYRSDTAKELKRLLGVLEKTFTQNDMQAALAESMAYLLAITSDSSSMTEIANSLWETGDELTRSFAKLINTSSWREPDWGDYAEKYTALRALYLSSEEEGTDGESVTALSWKLQSTALKMKNALLLSGVESSDPLFAVLSELLSSEGIGENGDAVGFEPLVSKLGSLDISSAKAALEKTFEAMSERIYGVIAAQKINTNVGEYAMTKLSTMFLVPLPGFERPEFDENGGSGSEGEGSEDEKNDQNQSEGGGIGAGAVYGSNDLVLDPLTGEYVEYGTLLSKYYAVMSSRLESGNYTEEQKQAIIKYFDLLYGGIKKDEGK